MVAFLQYTYMLINPFLMIINSYSQIQNMLVSVNKVYDILDEPVREYKGAVIDTKDLDIEIGKMLTCVVSVNSYIAGSYHAAEVKLNDKTYFIYPF